MHLSKREAKYEWRGIEAPLRDFRAAVRKGAAESMRYLHINVSGGSHATERRMSDVVARQDRGEVVEPE